MHPGGLQLNRINETKSQLNNTLQKKIPTSHFFAPPKKNRVDFPFFCPTSKKISDASTKALSSSFSMSFGAAAGLDTAKFPRCTAARPFLTVVVGCCHFEGTVKRMISRSTGRPLES